MIINKSILYIFACIVVILGDTKKNHSIFVPTHKWQVVKKGQPIPAGLHIRHNFETKITEAKLMNEDEVDDKGPNSKSLTLMPEVTYNENNDKNYDSSNLKKEVKIFKEHLKKSKPEKNKKKLEFVDREKESLKNYIDRFNLYKESLIAGTLSTSDVMEILDILNNLEDSVHHIDNAQIFTNMMGMSEIIYPCLNTSNSKIAAESLKLLGTAAQSNPKVQSKALEMDFIRKLLRTVTMYNEPNVANRAIFAIGALIRNFPPAQKAFADHGGIEVFGKILIDGPLQLKMRAMILIDDLMMERQGTSNMNNTDSDFEEKLIAHKYCTRFGDLTIKTFTQEITRELGDEDHDFLKLICDCIKTVSAICKSEFKHNERMLLAMNELLSFHKEDNILNDHIKSTVEQIRSTIFDVSHDEL